MVDDVIERISLVNREFNTAIALFGRTPRLAERLTETGQVKTVQRVEESVFLGDEAQIADPDALGLSAESYDLIIAPLALHWAQDLPGTMIQIAHALRPDGLVMMSLPGPETLRELRHALIAAESEVAGGAARRVDAFTDIRDAGGLLQRAGLALPVVDQESVTVRYPSVEGLIADLRGFGATCASDTPPFPRKAIPMLQRSYRDQFGDADGRLPASFNIVSLSAWKPHESQQKPLRPGSAKARLADALSAEEKPLKR